MLLEHLPIEQSESEPHEPHLPLEHLPFPRQSESEPHAPHFPPEHVPFLQSESEPQLPHLPLEHLPWPLQSESEPQLPHCPLEHLPYPAQSESEPQAPAYAGAATRPTTARTATAAKVPITCRVMSPSPGGRRAANVAGTLLHPTTKLMRRLGTNTTLRNCLPASAAFTFSSSSAAARTSASPEAAGTLTSAFNLPFTCTA